MKKAARVTSSFQDPREIPTYGITEAAHYLRIPRTTIRDWVLGRPLQSKAGTRHSSPIVRLLKSYPRLLSFMNLVEIHVLDALRRKHEIPLEDVRKALKYLGNHYPSKHPLIDAGFETDGLNLFIDKYGQLINVVQDGQLAMKEIVKAHLQRIERDVHGLPQKLYPFTRKREFTASHEEPRDVVIDPRVSFGRPVIDGTGIPTAIIAERYKAGESVEDLAEDYALPPHKIQEAIRSELWVAAA